MSAFLNPLSFLIACLSGWLNEHQQRAIEYLTEENRVLREQMGDRRLRFTDDQRRRLAVRAKELSRSALMQFATIVTARNPTGMAPQTRRCQVRRQQQAKTGPAEDAGRSRGSRRPHCRRKSNLGLRP